MPYEEDEALLAELYLDDAEQPVGEYGYLRKRFLMERRRAQYDVLLHKGMLHAHLNEYNRQARLMKKKLIGELLKRYPPPNKVSERSEWEKHMEILDRRAERIVLSRFLYR